MNNMNMNRYMWNRPGMQQGYNYGKRSADAEPTAVAEADADAYYRPYSYGYSQGYNWPMNSGYNMNNMNNQWNRYSNMNNMNNQWNRYSMNNMNNQWNRNSNSYSYGKRSADAEPMMYGPWGYPRYMSYMNRPYHYGYFY